ncbi:MAG: hypothetical protein IKE62_00700 [Oscillospiraceae bacterium]|nr:hypothetical protein [Oscillospiraceae bacterium]
MQEVMVSGRTLPEAYHAAVKALHERADITPCPDYGTTQKELSMTMVVEEPLEEPAISRLFIGGYRELEQYCQEMLDGILDFEIDRGNWEYTYHSRMAPQLDWLRSELKRNPYSRRAVVDIRDWQHDTLPGNDSPACLQHIQYFVREGKLHCKVLFRSNDAVKATFMNAFALIKIQERLAGELGYPVGSYTHRANSFHCYERDLELLAGYVDRINNAASPDELTYDYEGDWAELMEQCRPEIAEAVRRLRKEN